MRAGNSHVRQRELPDSVLWRPCPPVRPLRAEGLFLPLLPQPRLSEVSPRPNRTLDRKATLLDHESTLLFRKATLVRDEDALLGHGEAYFRNRPALLPSGNTYFHRANTCFRAGCNYC